MSYNMFPDYQCLEENSQGSSGKANRSIPDRIKDYDLMDYITPQSRVLDLGCNRGFFGIALSPYIKSYTGVDSDKNQIQYGLQEIEKRKITNVTLVNEAFRCRAVKYDIILCLAFHIYVNISMKDFADCLINSLNPQGHLFLEGHPKGYHLPNSTLNEPESYWWPLNQHLNSKLKTIEAKQVKDRELLRPFIHYQK